MKRTTFNLLFFIKKSRILKNGDAPIYLRVTINGKEVEMSLKRSLPPALWDTKRNKAKGNSKNAQELNEYINSVRGQLFMHQRPDERNI